MSKMDKNTIETDVVKAEENDVELRSRSKLAGTETNQHDMRVLGKTQQLNVSEFPGCAAGLCHRHCSAKFLLHLYFRILLYGNEHMGDHACVSAPSKVQASIQRFWHN
jgi:hypothetical protein